MKALDKFGGWIMDTRSGMVFGIIIILIGAASICYQILSAPKSVRIGANEFACTAAEPFGLTTRCTNYTRIK